MEAVFTDAAEFVREQYLGLELRIAIVAVPDVERGDEGHPDHERCGAIRVWRCSSAVLGSSDCCGSGRFAV
jgi:hypothetical protein